ncbi:MAG TPA: MBL fold metallo-hydrolase [Casimicrobiaceae bacterium]|jgi:glyoxylase-like metal-dependent hydrolase (beta-lactamase superfamily II)|nr:MBL fold metallo-hydrolase [Casimicrobiaceae bacterium]
MNAPAILSLEHPFADPPAIGASTPVTPGIHWLRMPLPFALDHINLWLCDGAGTAIVDCGIGDDATRAAWRTHFDGILAGRGVDAIVATHYHPDHVGNAAWLAARFGVPVTMTYAEFLHGRGVWRDEAPTCVAGYAAFFAAHGLDAADAAALRARGNAYRRAVPEMPATLRRIVDGDELVLGGMRFGVIVGHGHSPEHAALHAPAHRVLIAGDMLLPRISTNVGVSPAEPDGDPLARFLDSLARFEALPHDTLVLPSHGLPFRGIALRVAQLRAHHRARLDELEAFVRGAARPVSAADALPVLFRRALDLQQRFFAMGEAIAHLNHLWHRARIARVADANRIRFEAMP